MSPVMTQLDNGLAVLAGLSAKFCHGHEAPQIALEPQEAREMARHYGTAPALAERDYRRSYDALTRVVIDQWNALAAAGFRMHPWHGAGEPYASSADLRGDLRAKWLWYLPTDAAGDLDAGHPMREHVLVAAPDGGLQVLLLNDVFRAVHDAFGHGGGATFGPVGERKAWAAHRATMPAAAHLALWNETTGQNLWTNYGPHMWGELEPGSRLDGETDWYLGDVVPLRDRPFARQRIVAVPEAWL